MNNNFFTTFCYRLQKLAVLGSFFVEIDKRNSLC
jgi:hypothetical protein